MKKVFWKRCKCCFAVYILPQFLKKTKLSILKKCGPGTSLVVQWLRIHLTMWEAWVQSPVQELRSHMLQGNCAQAPQPLRLLWPVSHLVTSDSLRQHGPQHARLLCPSPPPGACSDSCPLCQRCHPTISSSEPAATTKDPAWRVLQRRPNAA